MCDFLIEHMGVFRSNLMKKGKFVVSHQKGRLQSARRLSVIRPTYLRR